MTQSYIPAGLGETAGFSAEATVGTYVAPARWIPHKTATFNLKKVTAQGESLGVGRFKRAAERVLVAHNVTGSVEYNLADAQFGLLLAHCIGSVAAPIEIGGGPTYTQSHIPGFLEGQSLSFQKGVPFTSGTAIQAFSYNGVKVTDWTIACATGQLATLQLSLDGWAEVTGTSYTSATYLSGSSTPNELNWGSGSLLVGGTVTTTDSIVSVSGGAAPTGLISSVSIKGTNVLAVDRFTLGSPTKAEQLTNGFSEITGEIEVEFATLADFYTAFADDANVTLQVAFTAQSGATGLAITIPSVKLEGETPNASGPGIIKVKVPFTALQDTAGDPVIQLAYTSDDTAV